MGTADGTQPMLGSRGENRLIDDPSRRLIVALDFNNADEAMRLVESLAGTVSFYKVGLELFVAAGPDILNRLESAGLQVFLDLKMDDVVETITRAVREVARRKVRFMTILGGPATARAAREGRGDNAFPKILTVTLLTSMNADDLADLGLVGAKGARFQSVDQYVEWRAETALNAGSDGLITSGQNVGTLRRKFADRNPILVCPGIRPAGVGHDDHKRACTPYDAVKDGADYLVVGRPIRDARDPVETAKRIIEDIAKAVHDRDY